MDRVQVVATTFLEHAARKENPVPLALLRARLYAGERAPLLEWIDLLVERGKVAVLRDGAPLADWTASADRARLAATEAADEWARYALDVRGAQAKRPHGA